MRRTTPTRQNEFAALIYTFSVGDVPPSPAPPPRNQGERGADRGHREQRFEPGDESAAAAALPRGLRREAGGGGRHRVARRVATAHRDIVAGSRRKRRGAGAARHLRDVVAGGVAGHILALR